MEKNMKIAVSAKGKEMTDDVDEVFGRCPYFIIVEVEGNEIKEGEPIENISAQKAGGAGISAAQTVAEQEVKAVISGNIGPRAMDVFKQFKIDAYIGKGNVREVIDQFIEGKLKKIE